MPKSNRNFFSNPNFPPDNTNVDNQNDAKRSEYTPRFSNNSSPGNYLPGSSSTYSISSGTTTTTTTKDIALRGYQGIQGYQGNIGSTGLQGYQGIVGFGSQGFQGRQGPTGSQGRQGLQGVIGNAGPQGNQGIAFVIAPSPSLKSNFAPGGILSSIFVQDRYAYVNMYSQIGGQPYMNIIDVTNPSSLATIGTVSLGIYPTGLYVSGKYAYVTNYEDSTLNIIDITNPSNPIITCTFSVGIPSYNLLNSVYVSGNYAYIPQQAGGSPVPPLMNIIDVTNPEFPLIIGSVSTDSYASSIYVSGRYAYISCSNSNTINIIDISIPSSPLLVGSASTYPAPNSIYVSGRYAYTVCANFNILNVVDISTPSVPIIVGSASTVQDSPISIYVSGNYAYVLCNSISNVMVIFDISNPLIPTLINVTVVGIAGFGNSSPQGIYISGNYAYITSSLNLAVYSLSSNIPASAEIGSLNVGNQKIYNDLNVGGELTSNSITTYESAFIGSDISIQRDIKLGRYIIDNNNATGPSGSVLTATENGVSWLASIGGGGGSGLQGFQGPFGSTGIGTQGFQGINGSLGLTANNGVMVVGSSSNIIQLGGPIIQNTFIPLQGYQLTIGDNNLIDVDDTNNTVNIRSHNVTDTVVGVVPYQITLGYNNNMGSSIDITMGEDLGSGGMVIDDSLYNKGFRYLGTYSGITDVNWIPSYGAVLSAISNSIIHGSYVTSSASLSSINVIIGSTMSNINYFTSITPRNALTAVNYYIGTQSTTSFILNFLTPLTGTVSFIWDITP